MSDVADARAPRRATPKADPPRDVDLHFSKMLESIADGFVLLDIEWRITFLNRSAREIFAPLHANPADLIGASLWEKFPELVATVLQENLERALSTQSRIDFEYFSIAWQRWFEIRVHPSHESVAVYFLDIGARKRAEEALRKQSEWLAVTLTSIADGVITTDAAGHVTSLNRMAEQLTGWSAQEAAQQSLANVFNLRSVSNELALSDAADSPLCSILTAKDGRQVFVEDNVAPIKDALGSTVGSVIVFRDVTERCRLAQARHRSEQLLADFFDNAAIGLHWVASDGKVIRVNRAELNLLGYSEEEYVGHHISEFHADSAVIKDILEKLSCGQMLHSYEARLRCKDGSIKHVLITSNGLWENGQFAHTRCFTRDITAQKVAQLALQESEQRKSAILRAALDAIIGLDHHGRITDFNPAAERIFGYRRDDVINQSLDKLIIPARLRQQHRKGLAHDLKTSTSSILGKRIEMPALHADGHEFPAELSVIHIEASDPPLFTVTLRDITEAKALQASQARLAAIVESSDDGIVGKTLDGIVTSWNNAAERMFGYRAEEMIGRSITTIIPLDRHGEETIILERLRKGERVEHYDTVRVTKDNRLLSVSLTSSPILDGEGNIVGASKIVRDVTERKRTEEALREADRRKDEFIATLAHELRNPLAPLAVAARVIESGAATAEQRQRSIKVISRQVNQMALLLNDLLDVSRITLGKMTLRREPVELKSLVSTAVETARPLIEANQHAFNVELPPENVELYVDRLRISQVLSNLLTNAAKYTNQGGHIELRADVSDTAVSIAVKDTGIGLSADKIQTIFEMFSQVDSAIERAQGGLGIGLSLVKGIVQLHEGSVTAHSPGLGRGSEFVVRLPRAVSSLMTA